MRLASCAIAAARARGGGLLALGLLLAGLLAPLFCSAQPSSTSSLWGTDGTPWVNAGGAASRLSDFSFAGIDFGDPSKNSDTASAGPQSPLWRATTVDGSNFLTDSSGQTDQTSALQAALDALQEGGALALPAGQFRLDSPVFLRTRNVTVRGAGRSATFLKPSRSLFDVYGQGSCNAGNNKGYGWCKGFFELDSGVRSSSVLATVTTTSSSRGDTQLVVDSTSSLSVGTEVYLRMRDDGSQTMYQHFLGTGGSSPADGRTLTVDTFAARVVALNSGSRTVTLNRPLPFDVRPAWSPTLRPAGMTVDNVGLEDMTFEFPATPSYPGHHEGFGFNAIEFTNSFNSWIRGVQIINADLAINLRRSYQCVVSDVIFGPQTRQAPGLLAGHHGVDLTGSSSILLRGMVFVGTKFVHDITVDKGFLNVVTSSYFSDLSTDHHGNAPAWNLWDNLITDSFARLYVNGGSSSALPHSGQGEVYWNVRRVRPDGSLQYISSLPTGLPHDQFYGLAITPFAGSTSGADSSWFLEQLTNPLQPESLYYAQLSRRLSTTPPPPLPPPGGEGAPCKPQSNPNGDPTCSTGLVNNQACCPTSCGACGGSGCSGFPGGASSCCAGTVLSSAPSCDSNPPPCVISGSSPAGSGCIGSTLACDPAFGICVSNVSTTGSTAAGTGSSSSGTQGTSSSSSATTLSGGATSSSSAGTTSTTGGTAGTTQTPAPIASGASMVTGLSVVVLLLPLLAHLW